MPIVHHEIQDNNSLSFGVWEVTEPVVYFEDNMKLFDSEEDQVLGLTPRKRKEWFASRYLLHCLLGEDDRQACVKDSYGKPHLHDGKAQVSLSHSGNLTAVIVGKNMVGIDIQVPVQKIDRIKHKYMSTTELKNVEGREHYINYLHIYWGAKEALYKAYGRRGVDFIKQLVIDPFEINTIGADIETKGYVLKDNFIGEFKIISKTIKDAILVYAIEA